MAITYNAGTNTITITGYTSGTPCNFTDIYNADVAGGWGVVTSQCTNQFCFSCKIQIGDGSTATWFADEKKQIIFVDGIVALNEIFFYPTANSHFRLGKNISGYRNEYGCSIIVDESDTGYYFIAGISGTYAPNVELYNSTFIGVEGIDGKCRYADAPKIYNCVFDGIYLFNFTNSDICTLDLLNSVDGLTLMAGTLKNIYVHDNGSAIWTYSTFDITVDGGIFRGNGDILNTYAGSCNAYLIDCDVDTWHFDFRANWTGKAYRQYKFDLKVQDKDENDISGAAVKIWDKDNNLVVDATTNASGIIATQTLNYGYYNRAGGDTSIMQTPHTIQISKAGYETYKKKWTLDKKTDWAIALHTPKRRFDSLEG